MNPKTGKGFNVYAYNPACRCSWCANGGQPPPSYIAQSAFYGSVTVTDDSYGEPHRPQRTET